MMRDKTYQSTRLGKDVVDYLKWKRLSRLRADTRPVQRDLRLVCLAVDCGAKGVTHADLMLVLEMVPEGSWKRVRAAWRDFFKWTVAEGIRPDNQSTGSRNCGRQRRPSTTTSGGRTS